MNGLRLGLITIAAAIVMAHGPVRAGGPDRDFWSLNVGYADAWEEEAFSARGGDELAAYVSGTWGWGPDRLPNWMGVEAELGTTASDGLWLGQEWSMISAATYLSATLGSESLYLKLRGGVSANRVDIAGFEGDGTGLAGSIGVGFRLFDQPLELNVTAVDSNVSTINLHWQF